MSPAARAGQRLGVVLTLALRLLTQTGQLYSARLHRKRFAVLRFVCSSILVWSWILYFILAYLVPDTPVLTPPSLLFSARPLLVVAHPDDESLFFGPTILSLTRDERKSLSILVLSCGNNYGLGNIRKDELARACERLGARDCTVLDERDIQDNPTQWWDEDVIIRVVKSSVAKVKADAIITFDASGISGHINHRAVSSAIVDYVSAEPSFPPTFLLRTVTTFLPPRKYIGVFDLPLTSLRYSFRILRALFLSSKEFSIERAQRWKIYDDRGLIVSSWRTWYQNVRAFWEHDSQRNWDRRLYILVSRYMWFNEIVKVNPRAS